MGKRRLEDDQTGEAVGYSDTYMNGCLIFCNFPPCQNVQFQTQPEFESHYQIHHFNECSACLKTFPDSFYLDLHLEEHHNPFMSIKREKGEKTYKCFNHQCTESFLSHEGRVAHLIEIHDYPETLDFSIIEHGLSPNQSSLLAS